MDESIEKKIIEESQDFSILSLFFQADIVVKIVILTLIASSVWSWTIIFSKYTTLKNILIETDAPYLSPEPLRGKSNEPAHVVHTAKFLANLKDVKYDDFCKNTSKNFFKLFGKLN